MAEFASSGGYVGHVETIRSLYREQRDRLTSALASRLDAAFAVPPGGWFVWARLAPGMTATGLLPYAEDEGVSYLDGTHFFVDGSGADHLRLSFSMLDPALLDEGVRRLAEAAERARRTR
jgi:DNA-binding transcriptional MocR family regulator